MKLFKPLFFSAILILTLSSCGSSAAIISTPIENIDNIPLKISDLTEKEKRHWGHLDLLKDTIPGMSVDKAYSEIIKNKQGKQIIVAVIDSGVDIDHEDLNSVIWTNKDETPNNGKDDDKNGYIDDVHGWNFLGDGYNEQLEFVRLLASGDTSNSRYSEAKAEYEKEYQKYSGYKTNYEQFLQQINNADETIKKHLNKNDYTEDDVNAIKTENATLQQAVKVLQYVYSVNLKSVNYARKELTNALNKITDRLNHNLNTDFNGRKNGDNPNDMSNKYYGNGNVKPVNKNESHGTHVSGILAAKRHNKKGINGIANNVKIMSIRAVPNGDEYDKDVALAIRYAVDNGASIINGSFGKSYSPHSNWVRDAIAYAGKNNVLIVHAAGNDSKNVDNKPNFPDDNFNNGPEVSDNFIRVGATAPKYGSGLVASFSNYGKNNVDVFAPGASVYSTVPGNEYDTKGGTSMAAPAVAGVAALIRSYYPKLSAAQIKQILMKSGLPIKTKVAVGGDTENIQPFENLSKSGKIVNAYNALILAQQMSKK